MSSNPQARDSALPALPGLAAARSLPLEGSLGCAGCGQHGGSWQRIAAHYLLCPECASAHSTEPIEDCQDGYSFHDGHRAVPRDLVLCLELLGRAGPTLIGPDAARLWVLPAGTGESLALATRLSQAAHGFESSPAAAKQLRAAGLGGRFSLLSSFDSDPWNSGDLEAPDRIWMPDLIEHFDSPLCLLEAARRSLRPGGLLVGTTLASAAQLDRPQYHRHRFSPFGLVRLLESAGFEAIRVLPFPPSGDPRQCFLARRPA